MQRNGVQWRDVATTMLKKTQCRHKRTILTFLLVFDNPASFLFTPKRGSERVGMCKKKKKRRTSRYSLSHLVLSFAFSLVEIGYSRRWCMA
jgi:hypothetical protein